MIPKQALLAAILLGGSVLAGSCSQKSPESTSPQPTDSAQYSIRTYIRGQAGLLYDQPLAIYRIVREGDKLDSAIVPIPELPWAEVIRPFANTDISSPEFTGAYRFTIADDNLTATRILTYEALRPDLFTRLFQINTDVSNHMIKSIYIETRKSGFWESASQKLLYIPSRIIQIQESVNPLIGGVRRRRIEYKFPADESRGDVHIVE